MSSFSSDDLVANSRVSTERFTSVLKRSLSIEGPTIEDVSHLAKALLHDLGPLWSDALRREFADLNKFRGYGDHPLFWSTNECLMAIHYFSAVYSGFPLEDMAHVTRWALPELQAEIFIKGEALYFTRNNVRILLAHCFDAGFGKLSFTCSLTDAFELWFKSSFDQGLFLKHFPNRSVHSKSMEASLKRMTVTAELICTLCRDLNEA